MIKVPQQQIPGVYHRRVGDILVTAVSDGFLDGSLDVLRNIPQEEARQILADNFRPARRTQVNAFLIYSAGRLALMETGSGNYLLPTAGKLLANIKAAGVDPADIETVLLTHMHPDHSAGLTDMATGKRNYPNAELVMHENEPRHWFDDAKMAAGSEREKKLFFQAGREQVAPYKERWRLFREGEVFPGRHRHPAPRPHARPYHLHGQLRQRAAADLGRHGACAGGADRAARGVHGLRHRQGRRRRLAPQGVRHGRHRPPAGHRHAPAFSGLCAPGPARLRLPADPGRVGAGAVV